MCSQSRRATAGRHWWTFCTEDVSTTAHSEAGSFHARAQVPADCYAAYDGQRRHVFRSAGSLYLYIQVWFVTISVLFSESLIRALSCFITWILHKHTTSRAVNPNLGNSYETKVFKTWNLELYYSAMIFIRSRRSKRDWQARSESQIWPTFLLESSLKYDAFKISWRTTVSSTSKIARHIVNLIQFIHLRALDVEVVYLFISKQTEVPQRPLILL